MMQEIVTNSAQNHFARYSHVESELIIDGCDPSLLPDLSVMIPTFCRPHLLKEAIESVVNQTAHGINVEIVIVDNNAETNSLELATLVESFFPNNIRLFRNKENIGMFGNWNRCIELARSPKLTILNDDDLLHPDFIRLCYSPIGKEMRVSSRVIFGEGHNYIWGEREKIGNVEPFLPVKVYELLSGNPIPGSLGMIMDKDCAVAIGGYDAGLWPTSDYDFTFRYYLSYGLLKTKMVLSAYRWLDNESLKTKTIVGFLMNDVFFRERVILNISCGYFRRKILLLLSRVNYAAELYSYSQISCNFKSSTEFKNFDLPFTVKFLTQNKIFHGLFLRVKKILWRIAVGSCSF